MITRRDIVVAVFARLLLREARPASTIDGALLWVLVLGAYPTAITIGNAQITIFVLCAAIAGVFASLRRAPGAARDALLAALFLVCLIKPDPFWAVGLWFADFAPTTDEEVRTLLAKAATLWHGDQGEQAATASSTTTEQPVKSHIVEIAAGGVMLAGDLSIPPTATGLVLFVHGSGSSRLSPRNVQVAAELSRAGLGTLLFDLLTPAEDATYENRFDIALLATRLVAATRWLRRQPGLERMRVGYFGASTGAAAALAAAAELGHSVSAVVSRGGRPDLAGDALPEVTAPVLLMTTQPSAATQARAKAGGVEIVEKPLLGDTLTSKVRAAVSRR